MQFIYYAACMRRLLRMQLGCNYQINLINDCLKEDSRAAYIPTFLSIRSLIFAELEQVEEEIQNLKTRSPCSMGGVVK